MNKWIKRSIVAALFALSMNGSTQMASAQMMTQVQLGYPAVSARPVVARPAAAAMQSSVMENPAMMESGVDVSNAPSSHRSAPNQPLPMTGPGGCGTNCGYSQDNLPPQPQGIRSGCYEHITGVDCAASCYPQKWCDSVPISFAPLYHGQYQGPIRLPAVTQYRMRVGDRLRFTYTFSREPQDTPYRLMVGDEVIVSSAAEALAGQSINQGDLTKGLPILPDGMIYPRMIGPVRADGLTVAQLKRNLEKAYSEFIKTPLIDVQPVKQNTALEDLRSAVDGRGGVAGGQNIADTVHADGTVTLPKLGPICVLGLTQQEIKREINLRYSQLVSGLEVDPIIDAETSHFIYVYGEVVKSDRYQLTGPTTVTQALALAGGVKPGGNMRQVVVFRRAEDWRLIATRIDIRGQLMGRDPTPADEIWLCDNDVLIVPPTPALLFDRFVEQWFTNGLYRIVPFQGISITTLQQGSISAN